MKLCKKTSINSILLDENIIKILAIVLWCIFVFSQLIMVFWFSGDQVSDAKTYYNLALKLSEDGAFYPNVSHLNARYIFGNGYVNFLSLIFRITTNLKVVYVINMLLTQLLLGACLFTFKKLSYCNVTRCYFVIMFCLLNTFISETVVIRTEMIFTALGFFALAFLHTNKKVFYALCGIILGIANWVRPLGIAFLIGAIVIHLFYKRNLKAIINTVASYVLTLVLIGAVTFASCGHFVYQATTFGVNLLMSANDKADGSYMNILQKGEAGYIEPEVAKNMTFKDFDKHYTEKSIKWILKNPVKYLTQTPAKLFYLYATETYSGSTYFNNNEATGGLDYIKSLVAKFTGRSNEPIRLGDVLILFNQIWYMFLCGLALASLFIKSVRKNNKFLYAYLLIMILGTGITLVVVGGARYHFPYLPVIIMYASVSFVALLNKKNTKSIKESN